MPNHLRSALDRAIDAFVRDMVGLFAESAKGATARPAAPAPVAERPRPRKARAEAAARPEPLEPAAPPPPVPAVEPPRRPALPRNLVPLRRGTDIHAVAAGTQRTPAAASILPEFLRALEPERPKGPSPEQLGERIVGMLWAAEGPMVFERIRLALATKKDLLAPVLDKLVAENRISAVEVDGVTAYKPPRIEPIRRRRPAEA